MPHPGGRAAGAVRRQQLERLCRYLLRPPFAHDAVQELEDGRVRVHFKAPWRRGIAHADMDIDKFLARLCLLRLRDLQRRPSVYDFVRQRISGPPGWIGATF